MKPVWSPRGRIIRDISRRQRRFNNHNVSSVTCVCTRDSAGARACISCNLPSTGRIQADTSNWQAVATLPRFLVLRYTIRFTSLVEVSFASGCTRRNRSLTWGRNREKFAGDSARIVSLPSARLLAHCDGIALPAKSRSRAAEAITRNTWKGRRMWWRLIGNTSERGYCPDIW